MARNLIKADPKLLSVGIIGYTGIILANNKHFCSNLMSDMN